MVHILYIAHIPSGKRRNVFKPAAATEHIHHVCHIAYVYICKLRDVLLTVLSCWCLYCK